ncbi:insulinase family protein [Salipaludibacillus agaradhaerens]|uniref:M16 family metallopeptidase n=1 Tax=Salipaludibacillus agaradhaerens TaxID=76935 RepID=UPI0009973C87|nr:pitrilysin family protein [Salipaludibacillus agaradhaerens]MCR6107018.1 insulinase family protein [Salipaludibacillus agaradhaerens]MCR6119049.1 insulinase family protein [Salipaludibacillus agaradhaerens]UJW58102.1 insulinase family protein [Bacillus sp. A116_S68]
MIKRYKCKNGVRIVFEPIETVRSVAVGIWVGTGSRFEKKEENGMSHFIEHMFFKGTKSRSAHEIAESFDSIGGHVNALTSKEYTCYYAKVLDTHAKYAVDVLADMYFNSTFEKQELEKEKGVVLEEIKMYEDTPDDLVHDLLSKASYGEHPLGFPILGTEQTLGSFSSDDLFSYMKQYYHANNVVISICGNVDESFVSYVEDLFSSLPGTSLTDVKLEKPAFLPDKIVRQKETEQAHLCLGFDGYALDDDKIYALTLMNNALGGSMSSRLFQEIRENRGLAYSVFSYHSAYKDSGMLTVYAGSAPEQLEQTFDVMLETIAKVADNGLTDKELKNGKEQLKGGLMLGLESTNSRMSRNGKNELLLGKHRSLNDITKAIDSVTMADIKATSQDILSKEYSLTLITPNGKLPPSIH